MSQGIEFNENVEINNDRIKINKLDTNNILICFGECFKKLVENIVKELLGLISNNKDKKEKIIMEERDNVNNLDFINIIFYVFLLVIFLYLLNSVFVIIRKYMGKYPQKNNVGVIDGDENW